MHLRKDGDFLYKSAAVGSQFVIIFESVDALLSIFTALYYCLIFVFLPPAGLEVQCSYFYCFAAFHWTSFAQFSQVETHIKWATGTF